MEAALSGSAPGARPGFSDGFGERVVVPGTVPGEVLEVLQLRPDLTTVSSFEFALRERSARLANFQHESYARVRQIDRLASPDGRLAIVSEHVEGSRLSDILAVTAVKRLDLDINAALAVISQLVHAAAILHQHARGVAHGAIAPERIVLSSHARAVVVEYVLGSALERLDMTREQMWRELRVAVPPATNGSRFDHRADVTQLGTVALALILGRPMKDDEFPHRVADLLAVATENRTLGGRQPLSKPLRTWLARALQLDMRHSFQTAIEAEAALDALLADEPTYVAAPIALETFLGIYERSMPAPPPLADASSEEEEADREAAARAPAIGEPAEVFASEPFVDEILDALVDPIVEPVIGATGRATAESTGHAARTPVVPAIAESNAPPVAAPVPPRMTAPAAAVPPAPPAPAAPIPSPAHTAAAGDIGLDERILENPAKAGSHATANSAKAGSHATDRVQESETVTALPPAAAATSPTALPAQAEKAAPFDQGYPGAIETLLGNGESTSSDAASSSHRRKMAGGKRMAGRKRIVLAAAAALLVLAAGGYPAYRYFVPAQQAPTTGTLAVESQPVGLAVKIDGLPRGITPLKVNLPPGRHRLELDINGETRVIPVSMTAGAQVSQYIEAQAPPSTGRLQITSEPPGAIVAIDGERKGTAPLLVADLAVGRHRVDLQAPNGQPVQQEVMIEAGGTSSLVVPMPRPAGPVSGWLNVTAPVELQVFEGGQMLGTSQNERILMTAGQHDIELANDTVGYRSRQTVFVTGGRITPIRVQLPKGTLSVNALPWAEVWIDGERVGETPIGNLALPVGPHEIVFRHPQYAEQRHAVTVTVKTPARVSVDLRK